MFAFVAAPSPTARHRENQLENITIERRLPKPVANHSWWIGCEPNGFSALAMRLFSRPTSSQVGEAITRESDWDGQ